MPGGGGRPTPAAIAHPWRTASIFGFFDLVAFVGFSAWNGQLGVKTFVIAFGSSVVIFGAVVLLLFGYRVAGDESRGR